MTTAKFLSWRWFILPFPVLLLAGCSSTTARSTACLFNPNGPIAQASILYLAIDIGLLLIVIVPATVLVLWTVWRYRRGGPGRYNPAFTHSKLLEVIVWGGPILLVGALSYFSVQGAFAVDPYHPGVLYHIDPAHDPKPLQIDVITTDWQWLFVYPQQGVAVSNKLFLPVGRKIDLQLTSAGVTNNFYILKIASQIYIMPGMRTERHFFFDRPGRYQGYSTEFSGPGFSWMNYPVHVVAARRFRQWVNKAKQSGQKLSYARFKKFARPTINVGHVSQLFNHVDPHLFNAVIQKVKSGQLSARRPPRITENMYSDKFKRYSN
jgi:cytochrome o ubiquinol oxidase subunit 2